MDSGFQFQIGDVVLAEWSDKLFYAKILHIDYHERACTLLFDDDSVEQCPFTKIHSVTETTAEIVCIVCKDGSSVKPNEIVLCDKCGIGYHQRCHTPPIEDKALEPEEPWSCVFCENGSDCPYLLNPFETKLRKEFVRKKSESSKDNHYIPHQGFAPGRRVRNLMANYYHDSYQRTADTSSLHARHTDHVMNRRGHVVERHRPRDKYYKFAGEKTRENIEESRKRRDRRPQDLKQKQRTSQDVWDNGGYTSRYDDVINGDDVKKGKEGPREKQRLTQDLERQRKKLKEDMKRGQELHREHSQLLTRDSTHDVPRDHDGVTRDVVCDQNNDPRDNLDDVSLEDRKRRVYGQNGTVECSDNLRNTSVKRARRDSDRSVNDSCKSAHTQFRENGLGPEPDSERRKLDPCDCDESTQGSEEHVHRIPDMQCEHSQVNGDAKNARVVHERGREVLASSEMHEEYCSETIEVLGESSDVKEERKEKVDYTGKQEKTKERGCNGRGVKKDKDCLSRDYKRSSCGDESTENEHAVSKVVMSQNSGEYESAITQNRVRSDLPRHNWLVERWINQKPSLEPRRLVESVKESTSTPLECSDPAVFEEKFEVIDEGYTKRNDAQNEVSNSAIKYEEENEEDSDLTQKRSPSKQESPQSSPPEIKQYSQIKRSPVSTNTSPTNCNTVSTNISGELTINNSQTDDAGDEVNTTSANEEQVRTPPPSRTQVRSISSSPRIQAVSSAGYQPLSTNSPSSNNLPAATSLPTSPEAQKNRKLESPLRIPTSTVTSTSNFAPPSALHQESTGQQISRSPNRGPSSFYQKSPSPITSVPHSPNRPAVSPKRLSSIGSQISPRIAAQEESGKPSELKTKWDTVGSSEGTKTHNENFCQVETALRNEDRKIVEVNSDGEENKRGNTEDNKEVSKIQTKSVNAVSPIVRAEKHAVEGMHAGKHETRTQVLKPQRIPPQLPPSLPFVGSAAYVTGYSPKTFSPHLITHNAAGMSSPVSPSLHGHPALQGRFPGRVELQHGKPDINCPFHGRKVEKMMPRVSGYPMVHPDAHMYPSLHENPPEAALKPREKQTEHVDFQSESLAMHHRLHERHFMMPHEIHMHPPARYLAPGLIDEHGFPIDNERFKHRVQAMRAHQTMEKSHAREGTSRLAVSPSEEKRLALTLRDDTPTDHFKQSKTYRHHYQPSSPRSMTSHSEAQRHEVMKRYNISPQNTRQQNHVSSTLDHSPRTRSESPGKMEKYSPTRHMISNEHYPGYIHLGEEKMMAEKPVTESNKFKPSPSPSTLDRESISRDFNERFNILDKTFKEKLEGTDRGKEVIAVNSGAHKRHGNEFGDSPKTQFHGVDTWKYRNSEKCAASSKQFSSGEIEQRRLSDRTSPRGLDASSSHKPVVPMPSYHFHGGLVTSPPHVGFGRAMVPMITNHGEYAAAWEGMRGHPRVPGCHVSTKDAQSFSLLKGAERVKFDNAAGKREYQEKERSLALEKHRMNLAQLDNETRKAFIASERHEKMDERRPEVSGYDRRSPRTREEEMRRIWELESRKGKLENVQEESSHARVDKRRVPEKIPDEMTLRKEQYLAMFARQNDPYGVPGVSLPGRARDAGNPGFYMGRQAEHSVTEALRKQREFNEKQESTRKMVNHDRDLGTSEPAKKRAKNERCICGVCGKKASFLCSGCQKAWYCSAKCQHTAWVDHCKECAETKRR